MQISSNWKVPFATNSNLIQSSAVAVHNDQLSEVLSSTDWLRQGNLDNIIPPWSTMRLRTVPITTAAWHNTC